MHDKPVSLIAMDMDGTLLTDEPLILPETADVLRRAAEKLRVFFRKLLFKKPPTDDPAEEKAEPGDWSNIPTKVPMDAILSTDLSPDTGGEAETPDKPGKSEQRKGEK